MLASSKMKPEKNSPGRKETSIAIWLARNCVRATVEISSPTASATSRKIEVKP